MSRETYVFRDGACVLVEDAAPLRNPKPSDLACPMVIADTMAPVQSMLDGKMYDSKAAIRATYRAAGVTEVGNDAQRFRPRPKPQLERGAIKATIEKAEARFNKGERVSGA
jgi:hypothetical protein